MSALNDHVRLHHILDSTTEIIRFLGDKTRAEFNNDRLLQLALTRLVEIIGEAANHISSSVREKYPDVKWAQIRGMRNRLTHAYFEVDLDLLWATVIVSIPELHRQVQQILSEWD